MDSYSDGYFTNSKCPNLETLNIHDSMSSQTTSGEICMLTGDCGGTNTRLSLWTIDPEAMNETRTKMLFAKKYFNENHVSFVDIYQLFLRESGIENPKISVCVLACAGPIWNNTVTFTNVSSGWSICGLTLEKTLDIHHVQLINDFAAMGYGLLTLKPSEVVVLHDAGQDNARGPVATIGAGTGLGECYLTPNAESESGGYTCFACEGGHADFAPSNELETELWTFLKTKFGSQSRISVERVISGIGLSNVYEFLASKYPEDVRQDTQELWLAAGSMAGAVVSAQAKAGDALCAQAMTIFVQAYGREAGNAALKYFPTSGLYLTGGLAPKNLDLFTNSRTFLDAFFDKGRVSSALAHIPVYLVLTEDLGERGAQYFATTLLKSKAQTTRTPSMGQTWSQVCGTRRETTLTIFGLVLAAGMIGSVIGSTLTRRYGS